MNEPTGANQQPENPVGAPHSGAPTGDQHESRDAGVSPHGETTAQREVGASDSPQMSQTLPAAAPNPTVTHGQSATPSSTVPSSVASSATVPPAMSERPGSTPSHAPVESSPATPASVTPSPSAPVASTQAPSAAAGVQRAGDPQQHQEVRQVRSDVPHNLGGASRATTAEAVTPGQQATSVLPPLQQGGLTPPPPGQGEGFGLSSGKEPRKQHAKRSSGLIAGIAIGAIIGAIAGGATAAIVLENRGDIAADPKGSSEITIANPEASTQVSAIAQVATPSTVTIDVSSRAGSGTGSGVIYSEDGYIVTNAHVVTIDGSSFADTQVRVMLSDGRMLDGTIVGTDPYADVAVIKVEAEGLTPITVAEDDLAVGDLTVAIGAPFNLSNTVTSGVVSTLNRGISVGSPLIPNDGSEGQEPQEENPYEFRFDAPGKKEQSGGGGQVTLPVIQTDASINPGNSGGPLLNAAGELIGINVAIASTGQEEGQAGSVGLGFAIPVKLVDRVASAIIDGEAPTHGLLGATVLDARASAAATQRGGLVQDVVKGSAAEKAGIRSGDIITAVDGVATGDGTSVSAMIRFYEGGTDVEVTLNRDGQTKTETVTLGTMTP
ncbi:S1C family serine protease [Leucobacter chinensis]|uniref:S1C family serine protease n=1 Tax=Leucobacter chinensis TaxID=2851010 RepID=UPI0020B72961|nr:trypsin-like peptidase domain-containing protein [Leucobacter chinensis]